jgi:hypothetical protein
LAGIRCQILLPGFAVSVANQVLPPVIFSVVIAVILAAADFSQYSSPNMAFCSSDILIKRLLKYKQRM